MYFDLCKDPARLNLLEKPDNVCNVDKNLGSFMCFAERGANNVLKREKFTVSFFKVFPGGTDHIRTGK